MLTMSDDNHHADVDGDDNDDEDQLIILTGAINMIAVYLSLLVGMAAIFVGFL